MKRARKPAGDAAPARRGAQSRGPHASRVALFAIVPLAIAAAAMIWLAVRRAAHEAPAGRAAEADPAAGMTMEQTRRAAALLMLRRNALASLPFVRHMGVLGANEAWEYHVDLATVLNDAALEARVRSSLERVALMRESIAELDRARLLAHAPRERARVMEEQGRELRIWGFAWEAVLELRGASRTDPSWPAPGATAEAFANVMQHPTRPDSP